MLDERDRPVELVLSLVAWEDDEHRVYAPYVTLHVLAHERPRLALDLPSVMALAASAGAAAADLDRLMLAASLSQPLVVAR